MPLEPAPTDAPVTALAGGGVARITLNRPAQRNPLDHATVRALLERVRSFEADDEVRVVVLSGAGGNFSAGGDLKAYLTLYQDGAAFGQFLDDFHHLLEAIERSAKVVLAVVEGWCVAGGLELLLACDLVLAARSARIGDAHIGYAQLPGAGGSQRLPRAVGPLRARHLMLTGAVLDAPEAERYGLVSQLADDATLAADTARLLDRLLAASPLALAGMKHLARLAGTTPLDEGLAREREHVWRYATGSADAREGLMAFAEKRAPRFSGR